MNQYSEEIHNISQSATKEMTIEKVTSLSHDAVSIVMKIPYNEVSIVMKFPYNEVSIE